jgi:hypothetical protein
MLLRDLLLIEELDLGPAVGSGKTKNSPAPANKMGRALWGNYKSTFSMS